MTIFRTSTNLLALAFISFSLIGLSILAVSTFTFSISTLQFTLQKQVTSSLFSTICLLGIIVGIFPSRCSRMPHFRTTVDKNEQTDQIPTLKFMGHHPTCGHFSTHIILLNGNRYCAGCTGLVTGAILSLLGMLTYSFIDVQVGEQSILVFWVGFIAVICGLLQYQIPESNGLIHFFMNLIFVVGTFLLLVGLHEMTSNFILETYLLVLIVYWIVTRILVSQLEHRKICAACGDLCPLKNVSVSE